jgi:hypothetical protein
MVGGFGYSSTYKTLSTGGNHEWFKIMPYYNQLASSATNTDFVINRIEENVGSGRQLFIDAQVNSNSVFSVDTAGRIFIGSLGARLFTDGTNLFFSNVNGVTNPLTAN